MEKSYSHRMAYLRSHFKNFSENIKWSNNLISSAIDRAD